MSGRALCAPAGWRRRWAALLVGIMAAGSVLVPVAGPASASGVQVPAKPSGLETETTAGSLDVSVDWDDVAGATEYRVRWRVSGRGQVLNDGLRPTDSAETITVADYGSWVVRVQACNSAGCSAPAAESFQTEPAPESESEPVTTEPEPVVTEQLAVTVSAAAEVTVGEAAMLSADITGAPAGSPSYRWEMSYGGSWWFTLGTATTASYLTSGAETVSFRVTVSYPSGESATSDSFAIAFVNPSQTTEPPPPPPTEPPARPTGLDTTTTAGSLDVTVDWDDVSGADDYVVQWRRHGAGNPLNDGLRPTVSDATITVADVGRWVVRVQACNSAGCSAAAAEGFTVEEAPEPPDAPTGFNIDAEDGLEVAATWGDTQGATRYELEWRSIPDTPTLGRSLGRSVGGNNGGLPGDSLQTALASATATVAGAGLWQFLLSACNDGGCSTPAVKTVTVRNTTDYDSDGDGLIDIDSAAKLNAIRWDLDGNGPSDEIQANKDSYAAAFPGHRADMGCPSTGCKGYELTANIDLEDVDNWQPIGDITNGAHDPYTAEFEGNGRTISNMTITQTATEDANGVRIAGSHVGLFSRFSSTAVVRNVGVINADLDLASAVVGGNKRFVRHVGVLVGRNEGKVIAAYATGTIHCERPDQGGNCADVGGLVGSNEGAGAEIRRSYAEVDLSGQSLNSVGGLLGQNGDTFGASGSVKASFATGDVIHMGAQNLSSRCGGLIGDQEGGSSVTASYAIGRVSCSNSVSSQGGLIGESSGSSVTASFYNSETSWQADNGGRGTPKTTRELTPTGYSGDYAGWNLDFDSDDTNDNPWRFSRGQYPALVDVNGGLHRPARPAVLIDYDSDDDGLIEINHVNNAAKLNAIRWDLDGEGPPNETSDEASANRASYLDAFPNAVSGMGCPFGDHDGLSSSPDRFSCEGYELTANVNLNVAPYNTGQGWKPIAQTGTNASCDRSYDAEFEGNGFTISRLMIARPADSSGVGDCVGLFALLGSSAEVRNLGLTRATITALPYFNNQHDQNTADFVGVLAGASDGTVVDSYATGTVTCGNAVGNTAARCHRVGGLVGFLNNGTIQKSFSEVDVSGFSGGSHNNGAGGLVGWAGGTAKIQASYAEGDVTAENNVGGLVGKIEGSSAVTASYSIGLVTRTGTGNEFGGLVGGTAGTSSVTNSYYSPDTSGRSDTGKGDPKTTRELITPTDYTTGGIYADWNLDLDNADNDNSHETGQDDPWRFGTSTNKQFPGLEMLRGGVRGVHRPAKPDLVDYDRDNDGLIDINSAAQLHAVRWDLNANGKQSEGDDHDTISDADWAKYIVAFPNAEAGMGCRPVDDDNDPTSPKVPVCTGYELRTDIDLGVAPYNSGNGWASIGSSANDKGFEGVFEGNNRTIDNLTIKNNAGQGLFGGLGDGATVRNLGLTNASISLAGKTQVGVLAGGIQGNSAADSVTVEDVYSTGRVTCTGGCETVGGLIGWVGTHVNIRRSYSSVDVSGPSASAWLGGLVGGSNTTPAETTIEASYATGNVTGGRYVGGLVGDSAAQVIASYATGNVTATRASGVADLGRAGGLIGHNPGTVTASYATGRVTSAVTSHVGGLIGQNANTVTDSYYDVDTSGQGDTGKGEPKTTSDLTTPNRYTGTIYSGWKVDIDPGPGVVNPWRFGNNRQYPGLAIESPVRYTTAAVTSFTDYDSDNDGLIEIYDELIEIGDEVIEIDSTAKLNAIRIDLDGDGAVDSLPESPTAAQRAEHVKNVVGFHAAFPNSAFGMGCRYGDHDNDRNTPNQPFCKGYELTADIDLDVAPYNTGEGWTPIGNIASGVPCNDDDLVAFTATFEGNGHTIANLMIDQIADFNETKGDCLGLFGKIGSGAAVRNLGLTGASVTATSGSTGGVPLAELSARNVGVLAGLSAGTVVAVYSTGTVTCVEPSAISDGECRKFGGLIGNLLTGGIVQRSYSSVDVSQKKGASTGGPLRVAGGLAGDTNDGSRIEASYATGDVTGDRWLGGLLGESYGTVQASYSIGKVTGVNFLGGLIGRKYRGTVNFSFYNKDKAGQSDTGKGVGRTTAELIATADPNGYTGIFSGWNLDLDDVDNNPATGKDNPWRFGSAQQYPGLEDVNRVVHRPLVPNLACTRGPGPDRYNPVSPCGSGFDDPDPEVRARYKDITTLSEADLTFPSWVLSGVEPGVRFVAGRTDPADCAAGAQECHIGWNGIPGFGGIFRLFFFANLEDDPYVAGAECGTRSLLVKTLGTRKPQDSISPDSVRFDTPANLPEGCRVKRWVASVVPEGNERINFRVGGAEVAFRDGAAPVAQKATVNYSTNTVTVTFDEDLAAGTTAKEQFKLQDSSGAYLKDSSIPPKDLTATSVSVDGATVTVRFASTAGAAKIAYNVPQTNPLQDAMGNKVKLFTHDLNDITPLSALSAVVYRWQRKAVITFNKPLANHQPAPKRFTLTGASVAATYVSVSRNTVTVLFASALHGATAITYTPNLDRDDPDFERHPLQDRNGEKVNTFTQGFS